MARSEVDKPGGGRMVESHTDDYWKIGEKVVSNRKIFASGSFGRYFG